MTENFLLTNKTAQKLYFECAAELPILVFHPYDSPCQTSPSNAYEALLKYDKGLLSLVRESGADERYIDGDASDFEKFRELCRTMPSCIGNPLYMLLHMELELLFDCDLALDLENCEQIWLCVNEKIKEYILNGRSLYDKIEYIPYYSACSDEIGVIDSCNMLEEVICSGIEQASHHGCVTALALTASDFERPNPYLVDGILKKASASPLSLTERNTLDMQINRIIGTECVCRDWLMLFDFNSDISSTVEYLKKSKALSKYDKAIMIDVDKCLDTLNECVRSYARITSLGNSLALAYCKGDTSDVARCDCLRRAICSVLGEIFEKNEYFEEYGFLCRVLENIIYYNLKNKV